MDRKKRVKPQKIHSQTTRQMVHLPQIRICCTNKQQSRKRNQTPSHQTKNQPTKQKHSPHAQLRNASLTIRNQQSQRLAIPPNTPRNNNTPTNGRNLNCYDSATPC